MTCLLKKAVFQHSTTTFILNLDTVTMDTIIISNGYWPLARTGRNKTIIVYAVHLGKLKYDKSAPSTSRMYHKLELPPGRTKEHLSAEVHVSCYWN